MSSFIVTMSNMETKEFFFSTEHCQPFEPVLECIVPVTWYSQTYQEVRELCLAMGETEIVNPDYNYIPLYILEELTNEAL